MEQTFNSVPLFVKKIKAKSFMTAPKDMYPYSKDDDLYPKLLFCMEHWIHFDVLG